VGAWKTVEGIYRHGRIDLLQAPEDVRDDTAVIVTFIPAPGRVDLRARDIDATQAADLRSRLARFAEDWDRPEMDVYDDYEGATGATPAR